MEIDKFSIMGLNKNLLSNLIGQKVTIYYKKGDKQSTSSGKLKYFDKSYATLEKNGKVIMLNVNKIVRILKK